MITHNPLTLCVTSDIHGVISATAYHDNLPKPYGLSRYSTALKEIRNSNEVIVLDNGDSLQGTPLLTLSHKTKQRPVILASVFNDLGLNYFNIGNHDFNYGIGRLSEYIEDCDAECLTSNVLYHDKPLGKSAIYISKTKLRLGLIGVCTDYVPNWEKPEHLKDVRFLDPIETVKAEIKKIRHQVDRLIVLYHGGLERDLKTGEPTEPLTGENVGYQIAQLEGIDVLFTGHQHRSFASRLDHCVVTQSNLNAQEFVKVEIDKDLLTYGITSMSAFEIDPEIEARIEDLQAQTQVWLDQPLGKISGYDLRIHDAFEARVHKHPLVSFINQVQLAKSGAQISATALFNQPYGLNPDVTYRDLVSTYIYPNSLVVKRMSGKQLKDYLEQCAEYFCILDGRLAVNPVFDEPKPQHFNYDMLDGIDYCLDISRPVGQRLKYCLYEGEEVKQKDTFTVVMNNYRAVGGGNFAMMRQCETVHEITEDMVEILAEYISDRKDVHIEHHDNILITANDIP